MQLDFQKHPPPFAMLISRGNPRGKNINSKEKLTIHLSSNLQDQANSFMTLRVLTCCHCLRKSTLLHFNKIPKMQQDIGLPDMEYSNGELIRKVWLQSKKIYMYEISKAYTSD